MRQLIKQHLRPRITNYLTTNIDQQRQNKKYEQDYGINHQVKRQLRNNKHTTNNLEREQQQENEKITGDIFNPFNPTPTPKEKIPQTTPTKSETKTERYIYKLRPIYSHTKNNTTPNPYT